MRVECKQYDSRTYAGGEVVRKCRLDLAPEAPWRCPDDCPKYERRLIDVGWQYGTMRTSGEAPEPEPEGEGIAALLDEAENILNAAGPGILADFEPGKKKKKRKDRKADKGRRKQK